MSKKTDTRLIGQSHLDWMCVEYLEPEILNVDMDLEKEFRTSPLVLTPGIHPTLSAYELKPIFPYAATKVEMCIVLR